MTDKVRGMTLAVVLGRYAHTLPFYTVVDVVDRLQMTAARLQSLAVVECNGFRDDKVQAMTEKSVNLNRARMLKIVLDTPELRGITFTFHGDPRGKVVKMYVPGINGDAWAADESGLHPWAIF